MGRYDAIAAGCFYWLKNISNFRYLYTTMYKRLGRFRNGHAAGFQSLLGLGFGFCAGKRAQAEKLSTKIVCSCQTECAGNKSKDQTCGRNDIFHRITSCIDHWAFFSPNVFWVRTGDTSFSCLIASRSINSENANVNTLSLWQQKTYRDKN